MNSTASASTVSNLIDGKAFAAKLRERVATRVQALEREHGFKPGLAVVLVGEDPASQVYVRNKGKQTLASGMNSFEHKLPVETDEATLLALVAELNADPGVNGILVQLPLPKQINTAAVLDAIDPAKDVDGFHIKNAGLLAVGGEGMVPCTPLGSLMLLKDRLGDLSGMEAVVVGRSNIVGKPMAQLLLKENCTVTIAHSRTRLTSSSPPWAGRRWSRATGSSPAPPSSTSASTASRAPTASIGWSATCTSRARASVPPVSRRCREASAR